MKTTIKLSIVILCLVSISCSQISDSNVVNKDENISNLATADHKDAVDVLDHTFTQVLGSSTLHRNKNGITVNYKTSELTPGHAYTLWWVIWNRPENCSAFPDACTDADFAIANQVEVEVMYAAGHLAGGSGKGNFSAHLNENDDSGSINPLFGLPPFGGLQDAEAAEVHLVLRSHGPAIPGQIAEQINSFGGGCTVFLPPFSEIPDEVGECADIQAAVHQPQ